MQGNRKKPNSDSMLANFRYQRKWKRLTSVLSVFVVIGTVSALMLPAVTMNQYQCEQEAHSHAEDCYTSGAAKVLACSPETLGIHRHTPECCDTEQQLICNQADFVVHSHDSACYDAGGSLVCALDEIEEHTHSGECCKTPETVVNAGHAHSDSCYARVRSDTPTCGMEASDGHQHTVACQATGQELTCEAGEEEGHIHTEECYIPAGTLLCTLPESDGHRHTDDCYGLVQGELTCTAPEREPVIEQGEPILICEKPQVVLHSHGDSCYTPDPETGESVLTCSETVVEAHQHTDACFAEQEIKTLTCQIPEHVHTEECLALAEIADETQATAPSLTEEEQRQVDDVITTIDGLPPAADVRAELERLENAGNEDDVALYRQKMGSAVSFARTLYGELPEHLKEAVPNAARLAEYDFLFAEPDTSVTVTGQGHSLTATYGADAGIPAGSELHIQPIAAEDAQYEAYCAQISEALDGPQAQAVWLYDIGFTFEGAAVEPQGEVGLQLNFTTPAEASADTLCYLAVHFGTDGTEVLPAEPILEDGLLTGFRHTQSGFSPTAYVAVGPTDNPADNGPDWLPVDYYVYIDGAWTLVGSTKTGWYGTKKPSDTWTNTNRDNITVEQAVSILGPYGFTGYNEGASVFQLFYQRNNQSDYNLHNDTTCYLGPSGKPTIPLARNVVDTMGYNLYYSPATTAEDHRALSALTVPGNSKFFSVSVLDANHLVYGEADTLPEALVIRAGKTVSVTVKAYEHGWKFVASDGTPVTSTAAENADGTVTYTATVSKKMSLVPDSGILANAETNGKKVHFVVWLDGKWTEVGSVDTAYYLEGYCKGANDSAGNARYRWFITTEQAYSVLAPFGYEMPVFEEGVTSVNPANMGKDEAGNTIKTCMDFMHQTGPMNTSGKDVYSSGNWDLLPDGKTWAIGMSYSNQEYTMYYVPGSNLYYQGNGDLNHTADIFAQTAANLDGSRFYSVTVRDDNQLVYAKDVTQGMTQYVPEGGTATVSVSNGEGVLWTSNIKELTPFQDENVTTFTFEDIRQPIVVSATEDDPTFTVQYYGNIVQYVTSGGTGEQLTVIDTSGKKLPVNGGTHKLLNIYLKESRYSAPSYSLNGSLLEVETKETVTKLYADEQFNLKEYPSIDYVDKLQANECHLPNLLGVLKDGKNPESKNDADFDWYYFDGDHDNIHFTNVLSDVTTLTGEETAFCENYILITSGTVLRIVYESMPEEDSYVNKATFHDYDITDGTKNKNNEIQVGIRQINLREYYEDPTRTVASDRKTNGLEGVYAFGNANCRTGLGRALWKTNELNKYNNKNDDVEGPTFGLVTGFDANNNLIWADGINAPRDLFSTNPRPGKTTYTGGSLTFNRVGDTYTLTAANSTAGSRTDLEYFFTPKNDKDTRTNNFWVLDKATNKKDQLMGKTEYPAEGYNEYGNEAKATNKLLEGGVGGGLKLPPSDDGNDHNWFFGMNFAISFNLTADYVGPLEYLFFGDDDLWIFLTNNKTGEETLICDIGGVHISVGQYVNLRDYLPEGTSGEYTLSFFYTERGASGSTCWMSFTLPSVTSATTGRDIGGLEISKVVTDPNGANLNGSLANEQYFFDVSLFESEGGTPLGGTYSYRTIDMNRKTTYGTVKHGGVLKLSPGDKVTITGLPAGTWYEITEQEDSRKGFSVSVDGASGYILKGSIAAGTLTASSFNNRILVELPATGGAGTILYTFSGWAVILTACALMYNNKRTKRKGRGDQTHIVPFSPDPENKNF